MGKFYFAFAWDIIVNLHACICKNKICIWSDPGVNLPICKYTPVCIWVRMRHLLTPSKICTPEYIYTCVFLAHANCTLVMLLFDSNITSAYTEEVILLSRAIRKPGFRRVFAYAKTKAQISCAVTAKLISAFVFAIEKQ